ncbi:hypothetical protein F5Y19DRAFT_122934 [Xylariaceae sp. FL1651]|nr:hypothetical protein F5Y19DRAFT_122934 [Xylariaceae sp. FL1651]
MGDSYLRTGRGGAGNFYSQKDVVDAATRERIEDVEAQKPPTAQTIPDDNGTDRSSSATTAAAGGTGGNYLRSGRGGLGNFVPSSALPTTISSSTSSPSTTATSSEPAPRPKYSGRGGAGNWAADSTGESAEVMKAKAEQEQRRKEALDAGIAQEIRANLPQPPRIYHLHGPGRGRRPEENLADS